jgi:hypothetical protein
MHRSTCSDDFLIVGPLVVRVTCPAEAGPQCRIINHDTPERAHRAAVHATEVNEKIGSVVTHGPRVLVIDVDEFAYLAAQANQPWAPDARVQALVMRVLTQGSTI